MALINARVVRRSLALTGRAQSCTYSECCSILMWVRAVGCYLSRGFGYPLGQPINWRPQPGEGPPPWLLQRGAFTMHVSAYSSTGKTGRARY